MRLFIAINFPEDIKDRIWGAMEALKSQSTKGNFSHRENLHLTLAFLGEIQPKRLEDIKHAMDLTVADRFDLFLGDVGKFRQQGGDIYWIGLEKSPQLNLLHTGLSSALREKGFSLESREFRPHITLGRRVIADRTFSMQDCGRRVAGTKVPVSGISLMHSERINGRLKYTQLYYKELKA